MLLTDGNIHVIGLKQTGSTHEHVDNKKTQRKRERKGEWICTHVLYSLNGLGVFF